MVYYDTCTADITPDADVGGYGVMVSFIVIAWMTTIFSGYDALTTWKKNRDQQTALASQAARHGGTSAHPGLPMAIPEPERRLGEPRPATKPTKIKEILIRLIDLQIVTGAGITIAGITQLIFYPPSFYHYEQINNYWWLTMQSLWVVPVDFLDIASLATRTTNQRPPRGNSNHPTSAPYIRIAAVVVSTILGCFFQAYIVKEQNDATHNDPDGMLDITGPCYKFLYPIWEWTGMIWVGMLHSTPSP
ncbi:hypothetical protein V8F06_012700 [Rhypophila decipiens]